MKLLSLEIKGFKSFADRVTFHFNDGVTCIVGPNGSGKSNILEAIRWVLGEQSAKSLRGTKMTDVIFNGSEGRPPLGACEVKLRLDNSDHGLGLDYDEVEISRRYLRSGESRYMINQTECRLKDLTRLFADTGLGKDGYSIINQGQVDAILSVSPGERRRIFDEACGLVRFKQRKAEANQYLVKTLDHYTRSQDLLTELASRLAPLEEDAAKARRFLDLSDQLKFHTLAARLSEIRDTKNNILRGQENQRLLQDELDQVLEQLSQVGQEQTDQEETLARIETDIEGLRRQDETIQAQSFSLQTKVVVAQEARKTWLEKEEGAKNRLEAAQKRKEDLARRRSDQGTGKADLLASLAKYEALDAEIVTALEEAERGFSAEEMALSQSRIQVDTLKEARYEAQNTLALAKERWQIFQEAQAKGTEEDQKLVSQLSRQRFQVEEWEEERHGVQTQLFQAEKDLQDLKKKEAFLLSKVSSLGASKGDLEVLLRDLQLRKTYFLELEDSYAGYQKAVQEVMQWVAQDPSLGDRVYGPLGSLMACEDRYRLALEYATGGAVHNIVLAKESDLGRILDYLRKRRSGRATFLPLDALDPKTLAPGDLRLFAHEPGYLGPLVDFLQVDAPYLPAVNYVLGRVVLCEDLEAAQAFSRHFQRRFKIVTLEGDLILAGGAVSGGLTAKRSGVDLINRQGQIRDLEEEIEEKKLALEELVQSYQAYSRDLEQVQGARTPLEASLQALQKENLRLTMQIDQGHSQVKTLEKDRQAKADALGADRAQGEDFQKEAGRQEGEIARLSREIEEAEAEIQRLDDRYKVGAKKRQDLYQDRADNQISLSSIRESLRLLEEQKKEAAEMQEALQRQVEEEGRLISQAQREQGELLSQVKAYQEELGDLEKQRAPLPDQVKDLQAKIQAIHQAKLDQARAREALILQQADYEKKISRAKDQEDLGNQTISDLKRRIWEEYHLSYLEAQDYCDRERFQWEDGKTKDYLEKSEKIRADLRNLGVVNAKAQEEYRELKERHDVLARSLEDLMKTKESTEKALVALDQTMEKTFVEHFGEIAEHFASCFQELFGGGRAEIAYDPDHILDGDIFIQAEPPGKKLKSLSLLSGGERALTAIALIFAIFRLKASPFCILDEVESALDGDNAYKFANYIRSYAQKLQFVVITHRKTTMQAANLVYGVRMQEKGVSSILSLEPD